MFDRMIGFLGGKNHGRYFDQLEITLTGNVLQAAKGLVLVQARTLHEQSLGFLDELSIFESLSQVGCFPTECLELLESAHRDGDSGFQISLLDRLDQECQDVFCFGAGPGPGRDRPRPG